MLGKTKQNKKPNYFTELYYLPEIVKNNVWKEIPEDFKNG